MNNRNNQIIEDIPVLPVEIKEAINNNSLIIFVGAGASNQVDIPLWSDLANSSIKKCFEEGYIDDGDRELIINTINDNKEKLSIAFELFKEHKNDQSLYEFFEKELENKEYDRENATIYSFCDFVKSQVLSTNADSIIDDFFQDGLIEYSIEGMNNNRERKPAVFKIHGSLHERDSLVFTTKDYIKRYGDKEYIEFLKKIFHSGKTILFLGYGLGEFELLDILLEKTSEQKGDYFIVNGYYSYEKTIERIRGLYFESLGVKQISYCKDTKGYNQLDDVLNEWRNEISNETKLKSNLYRNIRKAVREENSTLALQYINNNRDAKVFFLDEIWKQDKVDVWFEKLYHNNVLDVSREKEYWHEMRFVENSIELLLDEQNGLKKMTVDIVKKAAVSLMKPEEYTKKENNVSIIDDLLVRFDYNILGKKLKDYLDIVEKTNNRIAGLLYRACENDSLVKEWKEKELLLLFEMLLPYEEDVNYKKNVWEQCQFIQKTSDFYISNYSEKVSCMIIEWFKNNEKHVYFSLLSAGAVAYIEEKEKIESENKEKELLIVLKKIIDKNVLFAKNYCEQCKEEGVLGDLFGRLKIYSVNAHYNDLKEYLYGRDDNPFNCKDYYADLYSLIKNNIGLISNEEKEILFEWIMTADFGGKIGEDYRKVLRYDILKVMASRWPEYLVKSNDIKVDNYDEYPSIKNRSKKSYTISNPINKSDELLKKLEGMTFSESMVFIRNEAYKVEKDNFVVEKTVEAYINDIDIRQFDNNEIINTVPPEYYLNIARRIYETETVESLERDYELLKNIKDYYLFRKNEEGYLFRVCDYISNPKMALKDEKSALIVKNTIQNMIINNNLVQSYIMRVEEYSSRVSYLRNGWLYHGLYCLLDILLFLNKESKIADLYNTLIAIDEEVAKILFALNIDKIKKVNNEWLCNNIDNIISENDAYIAAIMFNEIDLNIYKKIKEKNNNEIIENADLEEKEYLIGSIMRYCINYSLADNGELDEFGENWLRTFREYAFEESFLFLIWNAKVEHNKRKVDKLMTSIVDNLYKEIPNIESDTTGVIDNYCELLLTLEGNVKIEWEMINKLVKKIQYSIPHYLLKILETNMSNYKKQVASVMTSIARIGDAGKLKYNKKYLELVWPIKEDMSLSDEFNKLNNALIDLGITDFID